MGISSQIKPAVREKDTGKKEAKAPGWKRPGSAKREKTKKLEVHDTQIIPALNVAWGSISNWFEDINVQGLLFRPYPTLYRRERWLTSQGRCIVAPLPEHLRGLGSRFDVPSRSFILSPYLSVSRDSAPDSSTASESEGKLLGISQ